MREVILSKIRAMIDSYSLCGKCPRLVWHTTRGIGVPILGAKEKRVTQRRAMQISQLLEECRSKGWTVHQVHPKTLAPIGFDSPNLHVAMSAVAKYDGENFPSGWFLVEVGAISDALFEQVVKHKIAAAYPGLYGHCMLGMGLSHINQCAVFLSSDDGDTYFEVLSFDKALYERLIALSQVLGSNEPPPRKNQDDCGSCTLIEACHGESILPVSCYSCHVCLLSDGGVYCGKYHRTIDAADAHYGCTEHLYNPHLASFGKYLGATVLENGDNAHIYEIDGAKIMNVGAKTPKSGLMFSSREIQIGGVWAMSDHTVQAIKEQFAGSKIIFNTTQD